MLGGGAIQPGKAETGHRRRANTWTSVVVPQNHWASGESLLRSFESSPGKLRYFCSGCGTHLIAERPEQAHVILRVQTLDEDPGVTPAMHIWISHDQPRHQSEQAGDKEFQHKRSPEKNARKSPLTAVQLHDRHPVKE
ncbi:GFA family protein [Caballeronia mineralivorans]|uniref:GFA family protein n=1 Tax=Caballeronia mineralivorans TaxID=2010198 RepID=UPI0009E1AA0F|nr:GFA family protein [Caballeronia mineralivorans]